MSFLTAEQVAAASSSTVRVATLAELQFASETMRLWNGVGVISIAALEWHGARGLGSVEGLQQSRDASSSKVTLQLSGVDAQTLALALASQADVAGRPAYLWQQLFTDGWVALGARIPVWWGLMQRATIERAAAGDLAGGGRLVKLEIENPFASRARPQAGRYTDADQQSRYPGDTFCDLVPSQRLQTINWPHYT